MDQRHAGEHARPVLAIPVHEVLRAVQRRILPARAPKGCVEALIELVMDGEEVANVVPLISAVTIVELDEGWRRLAKTVEQRIRQRADLDANHLQGRGFERLDEPGCIANRHNASPPGALIAAGTKPD